MARARLCGWLLAAVTAPALTGCLTAFPNFAAVPTPSSGATQANASPAPKSATALPAGEGAKACLTLAEQFERGGYTGEAILQYEKAREQDPSVKTVARHLAVLYAKAGEYKKAVEEFQVALKHTPKDANLHNDLGRCHYDYAKWAESEASCRAALAIDPKHAKAWTNLGLALAMQSKYDAALQAFGKVSSPAEAQASLAFALTTQGKTEDAKRAYREALRLDPGLRAAQMFLDKLEHPDPSANGKSPLVAGDKPKAKPAGPRREPTRPAADLPELAPTQLGLSDPAK